MLLREHARDLLAAAGVPDEEGDTAYQADNYNIAPSSRVRVVRARPGRARRERECAALHWGLPLCGGESRAASGASLLVNVRAESLLSKPGFREALMSRRCLIPASGFYEWENADGARLPWLFQLKEARPFFLAGIWDSSPGFDAQGACAIITTEPNAVVRPVHDRMPVIVLPGEAARWLDGDAAARGMEMLSLMPLEDELLEARRVSRFVSNARNNGPRCVAAPDAGEEPQGRQGWLF